MSKGWALQPLQCAAIRVSAAAEVKGAGPPPLALSICNTPKYSYQSYATTHTFVGSGSKKSIGKLQRNLLQVLVNVFKLRWQC